MARFGSVFAATLLLALPLGGCGKGNKQADLNALDAQLTNDSADLAGKVVVDPHRVGRSTDAILPKLSGDAARALADSVKLAGGKLLATPEPGKEGAGEPDATLASVARDQAKPGGNGYCRKQLAYGMQWANRLPDPFTVYPGAKLTEAAGAEKDGCTLRVASFATPVPRQSVMDYYYTQARRSGFNAEHQLLDGNHVLGGTRSDDDSAFLLLFTDAPGGGTSVDIIADKGR